MTTRALAHAYYDAHEKSGIQPVVKIMVPLVSTVTEYLQQVHIIDREMHACVFKRDCIRSVLRNNILKNACRKNANTSSITIHLKSDACSKRLVRA